MNNLSPTLSSRNYLIGGKDKNGSYTLRYFHYNKASGNIETQIYRPEPPYLFAIVCALPQNLESDAQDYQSLVGNLVNQCDTLDNLIKGLAQTIRTISERDNSVGKQVYLDYIIVKNNYQFKNREVYLRVNYTTFSCLL